MTNNYKMIRRHYHDSPKAGVIYCESSYELKTALILDSDPDVVFYETQQEFIGKSGKKRRFDFLVHYKNRSKKIIEIKPITRLTEFQEQIEDNKLYAIENGYGFACWTEIDLGWKNDHDGKKWIDIYLSEQTGIDYVKIRKERAVQRSKKHYNKNIATDTVEVWCEFCKETHKPLKLTYEKNIKRNNGQYICEKHGGFIVGSKPKKKKENPYSVDGKKQCNRCEEIKLFEDFGDDKTKSDGKATRCKSCRAFVATQKYQNKTTKEN